MFLINSEPLPAESTRNSTSVFWDGPSLCKVTLESERLHMGQRKQKTLVSSPPPTLTVCHPAFTELFKLDCRTKSPVSRVHLSSGNPSHSTPPHPGPQWGSSHRPRILCRIMAPTELQPAPFWCWGISPLLSSAFSPHLKVTPLLPLFETSARSGQLEDEQNGPSFLSEITSAFLE